MPPAKRSELGAEEAAGVRMPIRSATLIVAIALSACTTRLTPEGERVKVTRESADVAGCKSLGFVEAHPPYSTPDDAMNEMRDKTGILGGNVLFVTNYSMKATGVAYLCESSPVSH
jgi:hypothetical protein